MSIINKGKHTSQKYRNSYILLNYDQGEHSEKMTNAQISKVLILGMRTIDRVKKRFVEEGFEAVLEKTSRSGIRKEGRWRFRSAVDCIELR